MPGCTTIPELVYPDVGAAVAWLCKTFGFRERWRAGDHRAQLAIGDGAIAHPEHARERGARILHPPTDYPFGERQYEVEDPAGHRWTFSQTIADVAPEDWGGTSPTTADEDWAPHTQPRPTVGHGKICHVELPASDPGAAAALYQRVFGWKVRRDGAALVFDDPTDEVSGHWVPHRRPTEPGLLFYIWVDDVAAAIKDVVAARCELIQPIGGDPGEVTARFRDPGGNVVGLYQEPQ